MKKIIFAILLFGIIIMITFTSGINIQSEGKENNANKEISCYFSSEEITKKQIC